MDIRDKIPNDAMRQAKVTPIKVPFRYPWDDEYDSEMRMKFGVNGINIQRIVDTTASSPVVEIMDANTPRPEHPRVVCVLSRLERIDDFRMLESTTWIPLI